MTRAAPTGPLPLVAIGGTLCDGRLWAGALEGLPAQILVAGQAADSDAVRMADHAACLLTTLPPRFALMGFSLGGLIALELVAQAPHRIARLALLCAGAGPESAEAAALRRAGEVRAAAIGLAAHAGADLLPRYGGDAAAHRPLVEAMASSVGLETYRRQNDLAISRADSRPRLADLQLPVWLVSGAEDPLCPPARHQEIAGLLPDARQSTIAACGHLLPLERPDVTAGVARWLTGATAQQDNSDN